MCMLSPGPFKSRICASPEAMVHQEQIIRHAFNSNSVTVIIAMENTDPYCLTLFAVSRIYPQDKASQVSS